MRFYYRDQEDKLNSVNRSFFDAQHGRVKLALERMADLLEEFPNDLQLLYAEGLIRKDYLGQGIKARDLFERAFQADNSHAFSACNAAVYATDEQRFRKWAELSLRVAPNDRPHREFVAHTSRMLDEGMSLWEYHLQRAQHHQENREYGESAAVAELALSAACLPPEDEVNVRQVRAQCLRALDAEAQRHRETLGEDFQTEERLALREAMAEIDRALALDEYDAKLWNFRSAWCILLDDFEGSLQCADRAIRLVPYSYPKPHYNRAKALLGLGRRDEAMASARVSLEQASSQEFAIDAKMANQLLDEISTPWQKPTLEELKPLVMHILNAAQVASDQEMGERKGSVAQLRDALLKRTAPLEGRWDMAYPRIVAEMLIYFTPETAFMTIARASEVDSRVHEHCLHGALYLLGHSEGVLQRDTARLMALTLMGAVEGQAIREAYRSAILEPSAAATGEMASLDAVMRAELGRINTHLPSLIADQEPVNELERRRGQRNVLSRFTQPATLLSARMPQAGKGEPSARQGCGAPAAVLTIAFFSLLAALSGLPVSHP